HRAPVGSRAIRRAAIALLLFAIPLATVLRTPRDYQKEPVVVDGTIETACVRKGCWMELVPEPKAPGVQSEGTKLTRDADGSATEVSFIASGVELRR
ncbi:MAG TPA: hypothetical protein VN605_14545, partial [Thermoanaerobaculia bacterium]|nr:hypothetical protein [Thermoanaerobaculia bacterium]